MASICGAIAPPVVPTLEDIDDTATLLSMWDTDLRRAARARAFSFGLPDFAPDLEQEARLALLATWKRYAQPTEALIRTVLSRSVLKASLSEARWHNHCVAIEAAEQVAAEPADLTHEPGLTERVTTEIQALPRPLQQIFQLLYVEEVSQRQAAARLNVSQPRIAGLHKQLKKKLKALLSAAPCRR